MATVDFVSAANRQIWDFIHRPSNTALAPGTGSYSTPFRGSLFGEEGAAAVVEQLSTRRVDALWLGTNPGVRRSLESIITPAEGCGDLPSFQKQMESGLFGEGSSDFNPIERPTGSWAVYRDVLAEVGSLDAVAMANFIPWGSTSAKSLVEQLGSANYPLLERVLEFSDHLNVRIVRALSPRLLVVPFSLGRNSAIEAVRPLGLALARASDRRPYTVPLRRAFNFHTGRCERGSLTVPTVFLPHPSSLRLRSETKKRVVEAVVKALGELLRV